jgi:hypothetical protein
MSPFVPIATDILRGLLAEATMTTAAIIPNRGRHESKLSHGLVRLDGVMITTPTDELVSASMTSWFHHVPFSMSSVETHASTSCMTSSSQSPKILATRSARGSDQLMKTLSLPMHRRGCLVVNHGERA